MYQKPFFKKRKFNRQPKVKNQYPYRNFDAKLLLSEDHVDMILNG